MQKIYNILFSKISILIALLISIAITTGFVLLSYSINIFVELAIAFIVGALIWLISKLIFRNILAKQQHKKGLRNKFIITFGLVASLPAILIVIFAILLFYRNTQMWFDHQITEILDQSSKIADSYIQEHISQLKQSAIGFSDDMEKDKFKGAISDPVKLNKILEGESEFRNLDEAIIFETTTDTILAQTALSFSLSFTSIPNFLVEKANNGEAVEITDDPTKIQVLIKLRDYNDIYLLIGRLIDQNVINYINKNNGVMQYYLRFKENRGSFELKFVIAFCVVAAIILGVAIAYGKKFSENILDRINKLVDVTKVVKDGNLEIRIPNDNHYDELSFLNNAFNSMIMQLDRQKHDLIIAQRTQAWSDVARRVAHEIKNPLTPMQLSAEMLAKKFEAEVSDKERFARYIDTILRHIRDIGRIVSDFVNFAKLPTSRFERCELVALIREIVESKKLTNTNITYEFNANVETIDFTCDTTQMNQIMVNIIKNAEEAMEGRKYKKIDLSLKDDGTLVVIKITDTGPGFSSSALMQATEAYFTTRTAGTGLGLAIVKKIAQEHCGSLKVYNKGDVGGGCVEIEFNKSKLNQKLLIKENIQPKVANL